MAKIKVLYEGDLHNLVTHEETGQTLHTDAPKDVKGRGETFSPTDLLSASLGTCITTMIGIYAAKKGWDIRGMHLTVEKTMTTTLPRRVNKIQIEVWFPLELPIDEQERVEKAADACPVHHSLHPDIDYSILFHWGQH